MASKATIISQQRLDEQKRLENMANMAKEDFNVLAAKNTVLKKSKKSQDKLKNPKKKKNGKAPSAMELKKLDNYGDFFTLED